MTDARSPGWVDGLRPTGLGGAGGLWARSTAGGLMGWVEGIGPRVRLICQQTLGTGGSTGSARGFRASRTRPALGCSSRRPKTAPEFARHSLQVRHTVMSTPFSWCFSIVFRESSTRRNEILLASVLSQMNKAFPGLLEGASSSSRRRCCRKFFDGLIHR